MGGGQWRRGETSALVRDPINILLLDTNDQMGGVVRVHLNLLRTLDRAAFGVHLACLGRGRVLSMFRAVPDVAIWPVEVGTKPRSAGSGWRARAADACGLPVFLWNAVALAARCRRAGIRVIHTSDKKRALIFTALLHRLTGIPYIYHIHDRYVDYPANRRALAGAAAVVANSGAMREDFIRHIGPSLDRIRVVYNGVDPADYPDDPPSTLRAELGAAPGDVLIGVASRLAPDKGQDTLLHAAARVLPAAPAARFVLVGNDAIFSDNTDYVPMLRRLAADTGIAARTHFVGYRADMANIYRGLDVVVNTAWREAFGMVVVEGMACGKPVVGTAAGGIPEIITDGRDGFLFPVRDDAALAGILADLTRDVALRARVGAAARATVLERFTIQVQARAIETVYREVAG